MKNTKFEFKRVPFGLHSAPGYFSRIINETLYDILGAQVICYLDDILVFAKNKQEHFQRLEEVFKKLREANIKLKLIKCKFFTKECKFLGYTITTKGMRMNNQRVEAIQKMPHPKNKKGLQSFLGAVNYYRMFVNNFAKIAEPLYRLLKKNVKYEWGDDQSQAIETLKDQLSNSPILKYPNFNKEFIIHTDASVTGIGACLLQLFEGKLHPIAYVSRSLTEAQRKYSTTKREALGLVYALQQFRYLILAYPVHVYTDHFPLVGIFQNKTNEPCLNRWALLVQEFSINLHYIKGEENIMADVLSRLSNTDDTAANIPEELNQQLIERVHNLEDSVQRLLPIKVKWSEEELKKNQKADNTCKAISKAMKGDNKLGSKISKFKKLNKILFVHRKLSRGNLQEEIIVPYIPDNMMEEAFNLVHKDTTAGHSGFDRTIKLFKKKFYNASEAKIISKYCAECESCAKAKASPKLVPIEKYPIPEQPFHTVSSDILGPLPITMGGNRFILTIRDFTTRYTILTALEHKNTVSIIEAFRKVIANFGSPRIVITDNAKEFISEDFRRFLKFFNSKKVEISPYHPQSQGLTERINRELNKLLRIYTNDLNMHDWDELLYTLQGTINNTFNSSLGETPFYCLFGYDSPTASLSQPTTNYGEDELSHHITKVTRIRKKCREELLKVQDQYTNYTNAARRKKEIQLGERVYAKLKKFYKHDKLDYPISGPFRVMKMRGSAFELEHIDSKETFIVHPDYIIQNNHNVENTGTITTSEDSHDTDNTNKNKSNIKASNEQSVKLNRYNLRNKSV